MGGTPRLAMERIGHAFGAFAAVQDLSLTVAAGELVCLLGPSGCGKTTTLRIAAGVERQRTGRVTIEGSVVSDDALHTPPEGRSIGLMFQDFALFPHLSVADNVGFGLKRNAPERGRVVADHLALVGLSEYGDKFPHMLSGGEQQRVALARALAPKPGVMLMDEPFSGLDNRLRDTVRDETLGILDGQDAGVLMITHDPGEAMRMADRIALMRAGRIVQAGTPHELYHAPVDRQAAAFFSDINVFAGIVAGGSVSTVLGTFPASGLADGSGAEVVIRPHHIAIADADPGTNPDGACAVPATVVRSRFIGAEATIQARIGDQGSSVNATLRNDGEPPERGARVWLTVPRARSFVFAAPDPA